MLRGPIRFKNCFGRSAVDTGHSLVPEPPDRITGVMRSGWIILSTSYHGASYQRLNVCRQVNLPSLGAKYAFPGANDFASDGDFPFQWYHMPLSGRNAAEYITIIGDYLKQPKIRAVQKFDGLIRHCFKMVCHLIRRGIRYRYSVIQMQFARSAIIIKPIGNICILLHFDKLYSGSNRVDCSSRDVKQITWFNGLPIDQLFDLVTGYCGL